jgi:hypothetical protein
MNIRRPGSNSRNGGIIRAWDIGEAVVRCSRVAVIPANVSLSGINLLIGNSDGFTLVSPKDPLQLLFDTLRRFTSCTLQAGFLWGLSLI